MERDHNPLDQSGKGCQGNVTKYYTVGNGVKFPSE
jgi:hypothetical protein